MLCLVWPIGFIEEDVLTIFCGYQPILHIWLKSKNKFTENGGLYVVALFTLYTVLIATTSIF